MSIATLKRTPEQKPDAGMRSTEAQDRQIEQPRGWCREIVEAHGGTLEAGNRTDGEEGAVIRFWLPPAPATLPYGLRESAEPASIQTP